MCSSDLQETSNGHAFGPLTADIDGELFAAAFTDRPRAERFLAEQPEYADILDQIGRASCRERV